jgi:hypothetical protein
VTATMAPELAAMLAVAIVERHARGRIGDQLADVHAQVLAGRRLDRVAEKLVDVAGDAIRAAEVCAPCVDRPDLRDALTRPAPVLWPLAPPRPVVRNRRDQLKDRAERLVDVGALAIERHAARLEILETCDGAVLDRWEARILDLEVEHLNTGRPFEPAGDHKRAA